MKALPGVLWAHPVTQLPNQGSVPFLLSPDFHLGFPFLAAINTNVAGLDMVQHMQQTVLLQRSIHFLEPPIVPARVVFSIDPL